MPVTEYIWDRSVKRLSFSLRDLFWLLLVVAVALGWWRDHNRQYERLVAHYAQTGSWHKRMDTVWELCQSADSEDTVLSLIFMVSDPEPRISKQADDGLRRILSHPEGVVEVDYQSTHSKTLAMMKWYELYFAGRDGVAVHSVRSSEGAERTGRWSG